MVESGVYMQHTVILENARHITTLQFDVLHMIILAKV
jgi:hypothetical protein